MAMLPSEEHPSSSCMSNESTSCISEQLVEMEETQGQGGFCCRVCFEDVSELAYSGMIAPCKCKGTQKYVHIKCLRRWQENVQKRSLTDERAFRCGVCRSVYTMAPPDPRWITKLVHGITGFVGAAGISLLAFGLTGSPWPHLLLLLLVLLSTRSHTLLIISLLLVGSTLAALHAKGLRLVMRLDGGGRLGLAMISQGDAIPGLGPGTLLVASDELEHSIFRRSVVLLYEHGGPNGARGVILTQPMHAPGPGPEQQPIDVDAMYAMSYDVEEDSSYEMDTDGIELDHNQGSGGYWDTEMEDESGIDDESAAMLVQRDYEEMAVSGLLDDADYTAASIATKQQQQQVQGGEKARKRHLATTSSATNKIQKGRKHRIGARTHPAAAATARQDPSPSAAAPESPSSECSNATTRHFFGGPVGMPGEGVWQELAVLHNVGGIPSASIVVRHRHGPPSSGRNNNNNSNNSIKQGNRSTSTDGSTSNEDDSEGGGTYDGGASSIKSGTTTQGDDGEDVLLVASDQDEACVSGHQVNGGGGVARGGVVLGDVYQGGSLAEVLEKAGARAGSAVHIYHGVCSWAEGQLEGEIRAGSWGFVTARTEEVLATPAEALWNLLMDGTRLTWLI